MSKRWTGLHDMNGVRVYEGDIIEHPTFDKPHAKNRRTKLARETVVWVEANTSKTMGGDPVNVPPHWDTTPVPGFEGYRHCEWSGFFKCRVVDKPRTPRAKARGGK